MSVGIAPPSPHSRRRGDLDDVLIGNKIGTGNGDPDYDAGKAGDVEAALRFAQATVNAEWIRTMKDKLGERRPIVVGVISIEETGRNKVPQAVAKLISHALGLELDSDIVQSNSPKRTNKNGLDRIFATPEFDGPVKAGCEYLLVDDTLTQGGTFAALARHIQAGGGRVAACAALTGKGYSAKLKLDDTVLHKLRGKHGDLESQFTAATGYGFDHLTQSEARYLASFEPAQAVRDRIIEAGRQAGLRADGRDPGRAAEARAQAEDRPVTSERSAEDLANRMVKQLLGSSLAPRGPRLQV